MKALSCGDQPRVLAEFEANEEKSYPDTGDTLEEMDDKGYKSVEGSFWSEHPERFCLASINVNGLVDVDFRQS